MDLATGRVASTAFGDLLHLFDAQRTRLSLEFFHDGSGVGRINICSGGLGGSQTKVFRMDRTELTVIPLYEDLPIVVGDVPIGRLHGHHRTNRPL